MLLLTLFTLFAVVLPAIAVGNNCTTFNWDHQTPYVSLGEAKPVSGGAYCPGNGYNHSCAITASGDQQVLYTYNISKILQEFSPNDGYDFLFHMVSSSITIPDNGSFNDQLIGSIDTIRELPADTAGYITFAPLMRCVTGSMANCTGTIKDGAGIEMCAPVSHNYTVGSKVAKFLDGVYSLVNISKDDVGNFKDPFLGESPKGGQGGVGAFIKVDHWMLGLFSVATVAAMMLL
ncbi:hypothetical protein BU16DRAFT_1677 [Lophium mytilinum]|uniref:Uncharacterized protein n=1 Tax=Lophium mytilinum TaxID=390894 RepID=A0A6A6RCB7_9PEZI|nr:hypothetical protein BU16DRAFT_1677 [Lophium mytilinum]